MSAKKQPHFLSSQGPQGHFSGSVLRKLAVFFHEAPASLVVNATLTGFHSAPGPSSTTLLLCLPLQGQKRLVLSESCSRDSMSSQPSCTGLNYSYGVNAWKCWVQSKYANGETSKGDELRFGRK